MQYGHPRGSLTVQGGREGTTQKMFLECDYLAIKNAAFVVLKRVLWPVMNMIRKQPGLEI